jgi:hypothetical protein
MDPGLKFLDITIQRGQHHFSTNIYRKPTTADSIIPNDSCHPKEQKMAAIDFLYNRMNTYNLSTAEMQKEDTIQQILGNNKYDPSILEEIKNKKKHKKHDIERTKWAKFTHIGRETKFITKIFKNSNIIIALSANNTIEKLLTTKQKQVKINTINQAYTN